MVHERLDVDHWKRVFSVPQMRQAGEKPDACIISGPYDIAVLEQLRAEANAADPDTERVPTDVFVWYRGEPEDRAVTKIGGLPYVPSGKRWPIAPSGVPLTFVAQVCFADSRDITPVLPGDVLLIFAEGKERSYQAEVHYDFAWGDGDERDSAVHFEWATLGDTELVTADEVPSTGWQIMPCYAAIHRTWDYPTADGFAYPDVADHIPTVNEATKIGGVCPWLDELESAGAVPPGEYLCSLSSLSPKIYKPFPFLNVPEPIRWEEWSHSHPLMIGDVGLMYFFLNSYGDLRWTALSH
jgi:hypothetical protein